MAPTVIFTRDLYPRGEVAEVRFSGATGWESFTIWDPSKKAIWWAHAAFNTSGTLAFQIPSAAIIGTYKIKMHKLVYPETVIYAEDTMEVTDQPVSLPPGVYSKHDFLAEVQKKGFIVTKGMPSAEEEQVWGRREHDLHYGSKTKGIRIYKICKYNPPESVDDISFGSELSDAFVETALDKLPVLTEPICLWIMDVGLDKITEMHALYVYYVYLGASIAAEVVYNRLSPQPERIDFPVTHEMALGIYFIALDATETGYEKTGCPFKCYA